MKYKVIKKFVDKHTREIHREGETVTYDDIRGSELEKAGCVKEIKEQVKKTEGEE